MDKILNGLQFVSVLCYLDDVCICSSSFEKHLQDIDDVLTRFEQSGLKLGPAKCKFGVSHGVFIGHEISNAGIKPPLSKIELIKGYPEPTTRKELERALGLFNWFRKFIPNFSAIANILYKLLKKGTVFQWSSEFQSSFNALKYALVTSDALAFPRFDLEFRLAVDTSSKGIGYMLYQIHENGNKRVMRFGSKGLSKWQQSYGPTKLELLGVINIVLDCASYLRGRHFIIECDHQALKPLFQKQLKGAIYERWLAILQQFDCDIQWKPASEMVVPDSLSRTPTYPDVMSCSPEEDDELFPYVPEKPTKVKLVLNEESTQTLHVNKIELVTKPDWCDADTEDTVEIQCRQSNVKHRYVHKKCRNVHVNNVQVHDSEVSENNTENIVSNEVSILDVQSNTDSQTIDRDVFCNDSECSKVESDDRLIESAETCIVGKPVECSDSNTGSGTVSQPDIQPVPYHTVNDVQTINPSHSTSQQDTLSELDRSDHPEIAEAAHRLAYSQLDMSSTSIRQCPNADPELTLMIDYLDTNTLPESQKQSRKILLQQADYALIDNLLFHTRVAKSKRTKLHSNYQLVLPKSMIQTVLKLYHECPLSGHGGIKDTVDRVKEHYYVDRLADIVSDYVRSCHACQSRKITTVHIKNAITAYPTPAEPFSVWEVDLYGPLPCISKGNAYILTAIDMFTKFVFAKPIPNKDAATVCEALLELFTQYGVSGLGIYCKSYPRTLHTFTDSSTVYTQLCASLSRCMRTHP